MPAISAATRTNLLIAAVIVLAIVAGAMAVLRIDFWGQSGGGPATGDDTRQRAEAIDPDLIHYRQTAEIRVLMQEVRALAVGPDDRIYVGGDQAVCVFEPQGTKQAEIALDDKPRCLAIAGSTGSANGAAEHASPGWLYVGMADHVEVYAVDHPADKPADNPANNPVGGDSSRRVPQQTWDSLGRKALLSSIAVAEDNVFVADAGNKIVLRYDTAGRLLGRIGQRDARRKIPGFMVTSAAFDLAVAPDGLLRVVNPLLRRIEAYTFDGDLESSWGDSATGIAGFFGCCNPAEFAIFSDGRYVTAEKGIPRIKVYDAQGQFVCVVAGPEQMPVTAADLAVDSRGRILALDPTNKSVRVFAHK